MVINIIGFFTFLFMAINYASADQVHASNSCIGKNWVEQGMKDGKSGLPIRKAIKTALDKHKKNCPEELRKSVAEDYQEGYIAGIKQFCTYENGVESGKKGRKDKTKCPADMRAGFMRGYEHGKKLVRQDDDRIRRLEELKRARALLEQRQLRKNTLGAGDIR